MAWKSVAAQVALVDENGVGRSLRESTSSGFRPAFDLSTNAVRKRAGSRRALLDRHILGKRLRLQHGRFRFALPALGSLARPLSLGNNLRRAYRRRTPLGAHNTGLVLGRRDRAANCRNKCGRSGNPHVRMALSVGYRKSRDDTGSRVILPVPLRLSAAGTDRAGRPAADGWYWTSLLTAGTLGTAIGDCVAEKLHLGTGGGTLALSAIFAVILAMGSRSRCSTKASYWLAIIAVRSAGTTAGDWLAFREEPGLSNGLHLGLPLSTAFTCALFVGTLLLWRARRTLR